MLFSFEIILTLVSAGIFWRVKYKIIPPKEMIYYLHLYCILVVINSY